MLFFTFHVEHGRSLDKDIKGDTSGDFEDLLVELTKVNIKTLHTILKNYPKNWGISVRVYPYMRYPTNPSQISEYILYATSVTVFKI